MAGITGPSEETGAGIRDLTHLLWCSIDNDDLRDLDQLTVCEVLDNGAVRLWVAIADVDARVKKGTPIDDHALFNTTSVYTSAVIFPMLPERLSTDLTPLNFGVDRLAVVTEMVFNADASLAGATVYRAKVHNKAQLAYDAVSAWIEGEADLPEAAKAVEDGSSVANARRAGPTNAGSSSPRRGAGVRNHSAQSGVCGRGGGGHRAAGTKTAPASSSKRR